MNDGFKNYLYFSTPRDYHKEYYKKNRLTMKYKRDLEKASKLTQEVLDWKNAKLKDPYALFPFYDGSGTLDISNTSSVSVVSAIKC